MRSWFLAIPALLAALSLDAQSIFTVAGGGTDDGRPATVASLLNPPSVAVDNAGNVYFVQPFSGRIRRIDASSGTISTVAGTGSPGFAGDGGPATKASLSPVRMSIGPSGHLYVSDDNRRIRRIDAMTGIIMTVVGGIFAGFAGDGGPATQASLFNPRGVAVDSAGNIYIADRSNRRVRRVEASTGVISTVAGNGEEGFGGDGGPATAAALGPMDIAVSDEGHLYIADSDNNRVRRVDAGSGFIETVAGNGDYRDQGSDGGPATQASLWWPWGVALDGDGDLYIADTRHNRIRRVDDATGVITTIAGNGMDAFSGDGGAAIAASLSWPHDLTFDSDGHLYIADAYNQRIRRVDANTGIITTIAGNGERDFIGDNQPATQASLFSPQGLALDSSSNLFISDYEHHRVRRVDAETGMISTVAGDGESFDAGDGSPATQASTLAFGVTVGPGEDLFIAGENRIRRVDRATGLISTVAGNGSDGAAGDGGPATAASVERPWKVAFGPGGDMYIVQRFQHRVRRVDAITGIITTVVGNGNQGFSGDGGPATLASLSYPRGLTIDAAGNIYVADTENSRVRRVDAFTGIISTINADTSCCWVGDVSIGPGNSLFVAYGSGVGRFDLVNESYADITKNVGDATSGDGGPASQAKLGGPVRIALDSAGNLYIAGVNRVRAVFACRDVATPELGSPADQSAGVSSDSSLEWDRASGAFRYDVYLDTADPPQETVASDIEMTFFSPSNLLPLTTYYWKVVAKGDPFCEPFRTANSEVWSFTTTSECDVPGEPVAGTE